MDVSTWNECFFTHVSVLIIKPTLATHIITPVINTICFFWPSIKNVGEIPSTYIRCTTTNIQSYVSEHQWTACHDSLVWNYLLASRRNKETQYTWNIDMHIDICIYWYHMHTYVKYTIVCIPMLSTQSYAYLC